MATITIIRTNEYLNYFRNYGVYLDGKKIGTIANGQTMNYDVTPGQHSLVTKIDWCSSPIQTFHITEGETKIFKVGGFKYGNWLLPAAILLIVLAYFVLDTFLLSNLAIVAMLPLFFLTYYITAGRKNYLQLAEVQPQTK
ncbi:hypothetical protein [Aridibaculum aurantiacum]|uniref:hypothetical protein n=1 Tax=Aridibaculum aurantiacum TaxID=2810307 RepID=UPI001A9619C5|nr:hypothetical protein [Aridibaculum aurantiacum]